MHTHFPCIHANAFPRAIRCASAHRTSTSTEVRPRSIRRPRFRFPPPFSEQGTPCHRRPSSARCDHRPDDPTGCRCRTGSPSGSDSPSSCGAAAPGVSRTRSTPPPNSGGTAKNRPASLVKPSGWSSAPPCTCGGDRRGRPARPASDGRLGTSRRRASRPTPAAYPTAERRGPASPVRLRT